MGETCGFLPGIDADEEIRRTNQLRQRMWISATVIVTMFSLVCATMFFCATTTDTTRQEDIESHHWPWAVKEARDLGIGELKFYGRVLDQDNEPVAGARVQVNVTLVRTKKPVPQLQTVETDNDGRFSWGGMMGTSISILSIKKDGFMPPPGVRGEGRGYYISSGKEQNYWPDPAQPRVFRLLRRRTILEPLLRIDRHLVFDPDGVSRSYDLLTGIWLDEVNENAHIRVAVERFRVDSEQHDYNWSTTVEAIGGGFVFVNGDSNEATWVAPEDGYQQTLTWSYQVGDPPISRDVLRKHVFFHARKGDVYGLLVITPSPFYMNEGKLRSAFRIRGLLNPNHSPILQPGDGNIFSSMEKLKDYTPPASALRGS